MADSFDIASLRVASHRFADRAFRSPLEVVEWMGAVQAQDLAMARWAIGVRLPGSTEASVGEALDRGEILRTHVLRPTWHIVPAADIRWMAALTARRIEVAMRSRDRELGLDGALFIRTNDIIARALEGGRQMTREELDEVFRRAGIAVDTARSLHIQMHAEYDGIICSGAMRGRKPTFALICERAPKARDLLRGEALATLARRYFASHGPATLADFVWWSGLTAGDAREGMEAVRGEMSAEKADGKEYFFGSSQRGSGGAAAAGRSSLRGSGGVAGNAHGSAAGTRPRVAGRAAGRPSESADGSAAIHLLPAFDEYIIAYRDRSAVLPAPDHHRAVSSNGVFRPVVIDGGRVVGLWKKAERKGGAAVVPSYFEPAYKADDKAFTDAVERFRAFSGR